MIRNLVFDMGKVLMDYDANRVCQHYIADETMRKKVLSAVFYSQEWLMLDLGIISEEEALCRMERHLDTDEERALAVACFRDWHIYNKWPMEGMEELLREQKEAGFSLYLLSNASVRVPRYCLERLPGHEWISGMLFSAEAGYIKPQAELYQMFFRKFDLKPEECFFIDDMPENIAGALQCGMRGYCFADGDIEHLRAVLKELRMQNASVS